jgi:hypothetical protein
MQIIRKAETTPKAIITHDGNSGIVEEGVNVGPDVSEEEGDDVMDREGDGEVVGDSD